MIVTEANTGTSGFVHGRRAMSTETAARTEHQHGQGLSSACGLNSALYARRSRNPGTRAFQSLESASQGTHGMKEGAEGWAE